MQQGGKKINKLETKTLQIWIKMYTIFLMALLVMSHSQMWTYRRAAKIKSKTKLYTGNHFKSVARQVTY